MWIRGIFVHTDLTASKGCRIEIASKENANPDLRLAIVALVDTGGNSKLKTKQ